MFQSPYLLFCNIISVTKEYILLMIIPGKSTTECQDSISFTNESQVLYFLSEVWKGKRDKQ